MQSLASAASLQELKQHYRKLAALNHPDRGGNSAKMQDINAEYRVMRELFKNSKNSHNPHAEAANDERSEYPCSDDFSRICTGDTVYINGTESEVIYVSEDFFRVVAKGRSRQALINKQTGRGHRNTGLYASHRNNGKRYRH